VAAEQEKREIFSPFFASHGVPLFLCKKVTSFVRENFIWTVATHFCGVTLSPCNNCNQTSANKEFEQQWKFDLQFSNYKYLRTVVLF
jgi:hypothetical protein